VTIARCGSVQPQNEQARVPWGSALHAASRAAPAFVVSCGSARRRTRRLVADGEAEYVESERYGPHVLLWRHEVGRWWRSAANRLAGAPGRGDPSKAVLEGLCGMRS
jgi:hypothetical protein